MKMLKKLPIILGVIVLVLVLVIIFWNGSDGESLTAEVPAPGSENIEETVVDTEGIVVVYTDAGFSPAEINVEVGETVIFDNQSSINFWPASALHPSHAVYSGSSLSEHCPDGADEAFDACSPIGPGLSWSFTFDKPGTWKYHDHLSPGRTGTVVVQ